MNILFKVNGENVGLVESVYIKKIVMGKNGYFLCINRRKILRGVIQQKA